MGKHHNTEKMLKGRVGETLIEQLLSKLDYKVFRFGYETTMQSLVNLGINLQDNETKRRINVMPDFLVIDPKGEMVLVEVKLITKELKETHYLQRFIDDIQKLKKYFPECLYIVIDGEEENPIKACRINEFTCFDDFKPLANFLSFKEEDCGTIMEIEDFAQWFCKNNIIGKKNIDKKLKEDRNSKI